MIARVVGCKEPIGLLFVSRHFVEVYDCIKVARGPNPSIDGLAVCFAIPTGMVVPRPDERQNGCTNHFDAVHVSAGNDLLIGGDDMAN